MYAFMMCAHVDECVQIHYKEHKTSPLLGHANIAAVEAKKGKSLIRTFSKIRLKQLHNIVKTTSTVNS